MKIAFCLFGITGGSHKFGLGGDVDFEFCAKSYKDKIFKDNDVDVFIHTWSVKNKDKLEEIYKPRVAIYEPQIYFNKIKNTKLDRFVECSRWYSTKSVIEIQNEYAEKNKITYDFIMLSRFDIIWKVDFNFNELEKDNIYISNWNNYGPKITDPVDRTNNSFPEGKSMRLYQDLWIVGNQEHMNHISTLFERVYNHDKAKHSPHQFLFDHLKQYSNIKFKYYYILDYNLYRREILKNWM